MNCFVLGLAVHPPQSNCQAFRLEEMVYHTAHAALEIGLNFGGHHAGEVSLAEVVTQRFNLDLVRFTNSITSPWVPATNSTAARSRAC